MSERIREIKFEHFRGLPNYSCKLKGKNIVVMSGNGKGKSGIVDGIEFTFSGKIARFHGEGTGSIDPKEAIQNVRKEGEAVVEIFFTPTNDKIRRALSSEELEVPSRATIQDYVATHPPAESFILRRSQILDFISAQDANRYRKYIILLGLGELDQMQRAFVEASQSAENRVDRARQDLEAELTTFREPGQIVPTLNALLGQCSAAAARFDIPPLTSWDQLDAVIEELESRRSEKNRSEIDFLNSAVASFERSLPDDFQAVGNATSEAQRRLKQLKATSEEAAAGGIIQAGISFFHAHHDAMICPLCEKPLDEGYADTLQRLKRRDEALAELRQTEHQLSGLVNDLAARCQQSVDRLTTDLENAALLDPEVMIELTDARAFLASYGDGIKAVRNEPSSVELKPLAEVDRLSALRKRVAFQLSERRRALIPDNATELENTIALLKKVKSSVPRIEASQSAFRISELDSQAATQARSAFSIAREKAIQRIFDQIAGRVLDYYKRLHDIANGEERSECSGIRLKTTPRAAAGGLRLAIDFWGLVDFSDARAFLSEGHLDSLGLCIYLASVRMFNRTGSLLVLDDILTSIDMDHRQRFAELLFEEFSDYQIVLTTHDEYWFTILQSMAQARGDKAWVFKKISRWTLDGGPESAAYESTWEYIDANVTEDSYRELGGPLRLVLEDFLKRVAAKLDIEVKYNLEGRYTSGDFYVAGIHNEIREQLIRMNPSDEADITRDVGRVFGTGDLINFLSHDNPNRLQVTFTQTRDFVLGLKSLVDRCRENKLMKGLGG
jgi:DNA repair exonuclease SbcCD ATPase subunit